jgi:hypothetical protein
VPVPGPGVCRVCRGPAAAGSICFACRLIARRLGSPLTPVVPARLCPLPSPLYTVLLGYKESPVAEARSRFGTVVRALVRSFLSGHRPQIEAGAGGALDLVALVPSTHRPGPAPLALVAGLADDIAVLATARWAPALLRRADGVEGAPPLAHMRPDPAAFTVPPGRTVLAGARVLLLDDTYVSGARAQSAAVALRRAGARPVIGPLGRVLRPDRFALHAEFLRRHAAGAPQPDAGN